MAAAIIGLNLYQRVIKMSTRRLGEWRTKQEIDLGGSIQPIHRSLRIDQHAVGTHGKCGVGGKTIILTRFGDDVGARMTLEVVAVALPIAVETKLPGPCGREADDVAILRLVEKVGDDHNVVRRSALVPTLEGDDLAFVVHVKNLGELPAEAAR